MKRIFSLLIVLAFFASCETDVTSNTPAFQARKDNFMWRAQDYTAVYNPMDNSLVLSAYKGFEVLTITVGPVNVGGSETGVFFEDATFTLDEDATAFATYSYVDNGMTFEYSTLGQESTTGEIVLENTANQKMGTISGRWRFDAPYVGDLTNAPERINFQNGVFYEIPLTFVAE